MTSTLARIFRTIIDFLRGIPAPSRAAGHAKRARSFGRIWGKIASALVDAATRVGIEGLVKAVLNALKPYFRRFIVTVGDINEQYPFLFPILGIILFLLAVNPLILAPLLKWTGFGALGPVAGSAAAGMQSTFFGASVGAGSWFAGLQAAGMGAIPLWLQLAIKVPFAIGAFLWWCIPISSAAN